MSARMHSMIAEGVVAAARAATASGLLAALDRPKSAAELARELSLDPRAVALVLGPLCALGMLELRDDRYRRGASDERPDSIWTRLEGFLKTGEVEPYIDGPGQRGAFYAAGVVRLAEVMLPAAGELAEVLRPVSRIVDMGAGAGVWSVAMAEAFSDTEVVGVDLPEVVPAIRAWATKRGVEARIDARAGDYFVTTVEPPVDRLVLGNVLHLESEADAARLVRHCATMLADDGELVIVDFVGGESYERRLAQVVYTLHLGARTVVGKPHAVALLRDWCDAAGLEQHQLIELQRAGGALGALIARRAAPPTR
jgi:SAM-dependent methyltransferase